jgi:hypothetical protein
MHERTLVLQRLTSADLCRRENGHQRPATGTTGDPV